MFFAFWLSHVPPGRLPAFWDFVAGVLAPGGRAVFVDDGSRRRVVKVFHEPRTLMSDLTALGWSTRVRTTAGQLIGEAEPTEVAARAAQP